MGDKDIAMSELTCAFQQSHSISMLAGAGYNPTSPCNGEKLLTRVISTEVGLGRELPDYSDDVHSNTV